ncbi:MAG: glycosyl hydrolase family 28 protein [Chitinophagaceae bacterium]
MTKSYCTLLVLCCLLGKNMLAKDIVITKYGAVPDGRTINTKFIQKAIDDVSASGGGKVIVPAGNFMTGTLLLKSNVNLHVNLGGVLLGSHSTADYAKGNWHTSLIVGVDQQHVSITGEGIIDGQGQELMLDVFKKLRSGETKSDSEWLYKRPGEAGRAKVVYFQNCTDVKVSDITLKNASNWVQDYRQCDGVIINHITVQSTAYWNNDGLDVTDSKNVRITHCFINSSDDGICLKSENPKFGCDNFYIDSNIVRSSANGFKMGTANYGGFRNITVRNLLVYDTYRSAIALEAVDGGTMQNIDIRNVEGKNTGNAIFIRVGHRNKTGDVSTSNNIYIANVKVQTPLLKPDQGYPIEGPPDHLKPGIDKMPRRPGSFHIYGHPFLPYNLVPSSITGVPGHPVKGITLENIELIYGGRAQKEIANIPLTAVTSVDENEAGYPDFSMFGEIPAWGLYMRHAEGIKLINVKMRYEEEDFRPAIVTDDVKGIDMKDVQVAAAKEMPVILFNNTSEISTNGLKLPVSEAQAIQKTNYK